MSRHELGTLIATGLGAGWFAAFAIAHARRFVLCRCGRGPVRLELGRPLVCPLCHAEALRARESSETGPATDGPHEEPAAALRAS